MLPTDEGLDAGNGGGVHSQCGLVMQDEGPAAKCVSQCVDEGEALPAVGVGFGSVGHNV